MGTGFTRLKVNSRVCSKEKEICRRRHTHIMVPWVWSWMKKPARKLSRCLPPWIFGHQTYMETLTVRNRLVMMTAIDLPD